jgi:hypothetical protein
MSSESELWKMVQKDVGVKADGLPGIKTAKAILQALQIEIPADDKWPTQAEVRKGISDFGSPGEANIIQIDLPYPMRLSWDLKTTVKKMSVNKAVADAVKRIFQKTLDHYGLPKIKELRLDVFGGCYAYRSITSGKSLSMHAWGVAVDIDPDNNAYAMKAGKAKLSGDEYKAFWEIVEAEGAVSLGRARDYDWMHFQFARL